MGEVHHHSQGNVQFATIARQRFHKQIASPLHGAPRHIKAIFLREGAEPDSFASLPDRLWYAYFPLVKM